MLRQDTISQPSTLTGKPLEHLTNSTCKSYLRETIAGNRFTRLTEALESGHIQEDHLLTSSAGPMEEWRSLRAFYKNQQQPKGVLYLGNNQFCDFSNANNDADSDDFYFDELNKNNSGAPKPDKHYDCPLPPLNVNIFPAKDHGEKRRLDRETFRRKIPDWMALYFKIRKRNYQDYLWNLFHEGRLKKSEVYTPKGLPFWTESVRFKIKKHVNLGLAIRSLTSRLGLGCNSNLKFCIDGFFGLEAYGDIFGNVGGGAVPWMEINPSSTPESLLLKDGDMIFVNAANEKMLELVDARKDFLSQQ